MDSLIAAAARPQADMRALEQIALACLGMLASIRLWQPTIQRMLLQTPRTRMQTVCA
jgi:hypothetical protein